MKFFTIIIIIYSCTDLHYRTLLCIPDDRCTWPFQYPRLHVHYSQEDIFFLRHPPVRTYLPSIPCDRRMIRIHSSHVLHRGGQHSPLECIQLYYYEHDLVSNIFSALKHCNFCFIMIDFHERILILIHTKSIKLSQKKTNKSSVASHSNKLFLVTSHSIPAQTINPI